MNFESPALENIPEETSAFPGLSDAYGQGRKIKDTRSICPLCLAPVDAQVFERHGEVWMDKRCARHGCFSALLCSSIKHYYKPSTVKTQGTSCCGSSCGLPQTGMPDSTLSAPWSNHSCTILIEITERCNLSCPTCFAGSSPLHSEMMSLEEFTRQIDQLIAGGKRSSDVIQLSGGEPTVHPQFFDMVDLLFRRGFHQICINSNGIKLAQPAFSKRLASCMTRQSGDQLSVYLQFDGFENHTHAALRGRKDLLNIKRRALKNCQSLGINVHPVMTLTRGINDHEVGDFVRLAVANPALRNVTIQPAMYAGRYTNPQRQDRITLADTVDLICAQFDLFSAQDFVPIPCSDPNCFRVAMALRTDSGLLPISRYFPRYESWNSAESQDLISALTDTINGPQAIRKVIHWLSSEGRIEGLLQNLDETDVDRLLEALIDTQASDSSLWDKLVTVSIKPFMDAWTYDQDRIDQCCVHILDKQGNPVSFCEFNAINRPRMKGNLLTGTRVINA